MLIKLILKIWPSLIPMTLYLFWVLIIQKIILPKLLKNKNSKIIDGEFAELDENGNLKKQAPEPISHFSLQNKNFVKVIYLTLILMIICFLFFASRTPRIENGEYVPAEVRDGKIIPGKIINQQ